MTKMKKQMIAMIAALSVTSAALAYSTVAYFTDDVQSTGTNISTGVAKVEFIDVTLPFSATDRPLFGEPIDIMPGYVVEKNVSVKNSGSLPLYVRAKFTPQILLSEKEAGNESQIDLSLIEYEVNTTDWQYLDGYYYYASVLLGGKTTENLISSVKFSEQMGNLYKDSRISLSVRMEVVQSNYNGDTVFEATGWPAPTTPATPTTPSEGGAA